MYNTFNSMKNNLEDFNRIRNANPKDEWIVDFFTKNDLGKTAEELGLTSKDFLEEKYRVSISEQDEKDLKLGKVSKFNEDDYINVYKYIAADGSGYGSDGIGPNTRPFCSTLMRADKVYSFEDIVALNNAPGKANRAGGGGYSVYKYRGGNFCRHEFFRYIYDPVNKVLVEPDFIQPNQVSLR